MTPAEIQALDGIAATLIPLGIRFSDQGKCRQQDHEIETLTDECYRIATLILKAREEWVKEVSAPPKKK